ncbi:MAG: hypothetical protein Phog2KO_27690 [Phototrophicaceae bacterium]
MREIWDIAWHRFNVIQAIVSDANARIIAILFYFTILVPFGVGYSLMSDPFNEKETTKDGKKTNVGQAWHDREPVPSDLDSARLQG